MTLSVSSTTPLKAYREKFCRHAQRATWLLAVCTVAACAEGTKQDKGTAIPASKVVATPSSQALDYVPPHDSLIPNDSMGASIRRGIALFANTTDSLPEYAPGAMQCMSCHVDSGRRRDAAPLFGVHARFPKYMDRSAAVIPIEDRINYCFTRSLAGKKLPNGSREMQDMVAYFAFISRGVPIGAKLVGEGMPKMPKLVGDSTRGAIVYARTCTPCHQPDGQGVANLIPPVWGPKSYSIGASMAREDRAASFIKYFMPKTSPNSLTDQESFDVAAYINSHPRPDSPGKENDWPNGGAPFDVPYETKGHLAYRPPSKLVPRKEAQGTVVPVPPPVKRKIAGRPSNSGEQ